MCRLLAHLKVLIGAEELRSFLNMDEKKSVLVSADLDVKSFWGEMENGKEFASSFRIPELEGFLPSGTHGN